jgi:excisionase family DNA binding protein
MRTKSDQNSRSLVAGGLLTIAEAANFLKVSRSKIYLLLNAGKLESTKIDGCRRVPLHAVEILAAKSLGTVA